MELPLVSVIINCYNGEKYLHDAIDSVMTQTYENWELVVWDNQSTDSTEKIVRSYHSNKIRYFCAQKHTTLGTARNQALEIIKGDYVGFLDVDDKWVPSFLLNYVDAIKRNPEAVLVYSNYYCQEGEKIWFAYEKENSGIVKARTFVNKYNIAISAALFRSDIIRKERIRFNTNFSLIEDYDFFIKLSLFGPIEYISQPLMIYLYHENNLSHSTKWGEEFNMFLNLLENPKGVYRKVSCYKKIIKSRVYYTIANCYILAGEKRKALSIIKRNIIRNPFFIILLIKIILGPYSLRRLQIKKRSV